MSNNKDLDKYTFHYVSMPGSFTDILKSNISNSSHFLEKVENHLDKDKAIVAILANMKQFSNQSFTMTSVIKTLGPIGIRNILAEAYLYKNNNGNFPTDHSETYIKDILEIEELYNEHTSSENYRLFLLGFYLKYLSNKKSQINPLSIKYIKIRPETLKLLNLGKRKSLHLDWIVLILHFFSIFIGIDKLEQLLRSKKTYTDIYSSLSKNNKIFFNKNLLSYATSINEDSFLFENFI